MNKKYKKPPKIKTELELQKLREGGKIWQKIKQEISLKIKSGISGIDIEKEIEILFKKYNVLPAFKNFNSFPGLICISVNDCIVHGLANNKKLVSGDKITLDIGFFYEGICIDSAFTMIIDPENNPEYKKFIDSALQVLWDAINVVKENCTTGDICSKIVESFNLNIPNSFGILKNFCGHGIGTSVHEDPLVPNSGLKRTEGAVLPLNSVVCIEPMFVEDPTGEYIIGKNDFDVLSIKENAKTVHWEHMVAITKNGIEVLTASEEEIKKYLNYGN